jgi:hypothetical protein
LRNRDLSPPLSHKIFNRIFGRLRREGTEPHAPFMVPIIPDPEQTFHSRLYRVGLIGHRHMAAMPLNERPVTSNNFISGANVPGLTTAGEV